MRESYASGEGAPSTRSCTFSAISSICVSDDAPGREKASGSAKRVGIRTHLRLSLSCREMEFHQGRLLDHIHLRVRDLEASKRFYRAGLQALGRSLTRESESAFLADELYVSADGEPTSGLHFAFQAADRDAVERFYDAAVAAGGRDNGRPGERDYHPGYYAAYVLDPDGNNVEAVFHGPTTRSAASVVVTPA